MNPENALLDLAALKRHCRATAARLRRVNAALSAWDEYDGILAGQWGR